MTTQTAAIDCADVSFRFNGEPVLEHVTFSVRQGEYVGIIGPNGGGKTTLLKLILGLLRPSTGGIKVLGETTTHRRGCSCIGYVPQRSAQADGSFPATVEEIVYSGRTAHNGLFKNFDRADELAVEKAMGMTDVLKFRNRRISQLSGGERQRVSIARALAGQPQILILDEPATGVDAQSQEQFHGFLKTLNRDMGLTILFVSHDIDVVTREAETILCVNRSLQCRLSSEDFLKDANLKSYYGDGIHALHHHHHSA